MAKTPYSAVSPVGLMEVPATQPDPSTEREKALVAWVMDHVKDWRNHRDSNYKKKWEEYYRLWRGVWVSEDKNRDSERSKLISPALQQAIEATTAELEEATFGKGEWFDISDDVADEQKEEFGKIHRLLKEDFAFDKVPHSIAVIYLMGALYGTGIGKILVDEEHYKEITEGEGDDLVGQIAVSTDKTRICVKLEPISPMQFVIDPAARTIDEALGCAHEVIKSAHSVYSKQKLGVYKDVAIGAWDGTEDLSALGESRPTKGSEDRVYITEYHGMVPKNLLPSGTEEVVDDVGLVEAIVTIANESIVLREVENPLLKQDRGFVSYQHDTVPNRFWGRGIAEKGYNPQKALDAELRARIDGLALTVHPMIAGDATRLPRGTNLTVSPGKQILTHGRPSEVLMPFNFGTLDPNIFRDSADLERMIQMGTGAFDSAAPSDVNSRNQTASGMSMILSGAIKRSKRTMKNISECFLTPFIEKALWRKMQFEPERYPVKDYKFVVTSTMGIMAREFEHAQLTQLLQTVPPASPVYFLVLKSIFETSSISNKDETLEMINQMLQQTMQPPQPPQPEISDQIKMAALEETKRNNRAKEAIERDRIGANVLMDRIGAKESRSQT